MSLNYTIYDKPGYCQWHDCVLVERLPELPGTYFCFSCAEAARPDLAATLDRAAQMVDDGVKVPLKAEILREAARRLRDV